MIALVMLLAACSKYQSAKNYNSLKSSFLNPINAAKPGVYWYFMDGNQDKAEMTTDLESINQKYDADLKKLLSLKFQFFQNQNVLFYPVL